MVDETKLAKEKLAKDIVGEIVLSDNPEKILKKWRSIFNFSQKKVAKCLGITSSVISDYESGRRKSPGINVIKKYVNALLDLDLRSGGKVIKSFSQSFFQSPKISEAVIDIKEFSSGIDINTFCKRISADMLTKSVGRVEREIYGYTIIDSVKAISELSFNQLIGLYGTTTQRALLFTGVSTGRTPMVAIKLTNLQPGLVVLHGIEQVDEVAKNIAEAENIPLALCRLEGVEDVVSRLKELD
ncbi:MAG: helix-turn-helix domain-containing protein [Candidatus Aenigmarchaeota archaeon]|nr:helix-turn-helix domain-containing protein [Candidatus Aenigmarchaeota archaeon]